MLQLDDGSLRALGDPTKEDVYNLTFADWPAAMSRLPLVRKKPPVRNDKSFAGILCGWARIFSAG